jgi:hypothetical protein
VWKTDVEEGELGSGLMCFRQKKRENERKKKTFELIHIKRKDYSEEKSGRYVHSTTEERKKNGLSTAAFHPTKGEIMIEGKMTGRRRRSHANCLFGAFLR